VFQTLISETTAEIMGAAGIPLNLFDSPGLSFEQFAKLQRAIHAALTCLALHNEHPLVLVARAAKGDREAVLSLIKVDKLFLQDSCCAGTIRKATLQGDQDFIRRLRNALEYKPRLRRRDAFHVYCYTLLLLESWGVVLPTLNELWSTLDPCGIEYDSLSAFERDFQRRRRDFTKMFTEAT
jgi:hypothetical protein